MLTAYKLTDLVNNLQSIQACNSKITRVLFDGTAFCPLSKQFDLAPYNPFKALSIKSVDRHYPLREKLRALIAVRRGLKKEQESSIKSV